MGVPFAPGLDSLTPLTLDLLAVLVPISLDGEFTAVKMEER